MKIEKKLQWFLAANILILLLITFNSTALQFFHGITQAFYGGNAATKTFLVFLALAASSILSLVVIKTGKMPDKKNARKFFLAMILIAVLGLAIGLAQQAFFASELNANYPIATINAEMTNWEATTLYHNHSTKGAIYYLTQILGLNSSAFDTGQPLYNLQQNPETWAIALLIIIVLVTVFGLLHINTMLDKIGFVDFLVFNLGLVGMISVMLDGGAGATVMLPTLLFLSIYFSSNFLKTDNKTLKDLSPLMFTAFLPFVVGPVYNIYSLSDNFATPLIAAVGLGYFIWAQGKESLQKPLNWAVILLFLFFLPSFFAVISSFGFGATTLNLSSEFTKNPVDGEGDGFFIYGLPREATKEKIDAIVSEYGEIKESHKMEWLGYYRIIPLRQFRSGELEERLRQELRPETYLYVEHVIPTEKERMLIVHWLENNNQSEILPENFFGITIREKRDSGNKTFLKTRSKLITEWEMLAILTKIRSQSNQKIAVSFMS